MSGEWERLHVIAHLELELPAVPEELPRARHAVTELCERLALEDDLIERVRIAVTEACTNCVLHAYGAGRRGSTYMLETRLGVDALFVIVNDCGDGTAEGHGSPNAGLGLGLQLIERLTDGTDITSRAGHGTRIVMRFATDAHVQNL